MKDLKISNYMALRLPDSEGDIEIEFNVNGHEISDYVPFKKLEKWVASISEKNNKKLQVDTKPCECCFDWSKDPSASFCGNCGRPLSN